MTGVYEATVRGTDIRTKRGRTKTYTIDIGKWGREPDAEQRVKHKAKRKAYSDGLMADSISVTPVYQA